MLSAVICMERIQRQHTPRLASGNEFMSALGSVNDIRAEIEELLANRTHR